MFFTVPALSPDAIFLRPPFARAGTKKKNNIQTVGSDDDDDDQICAVHRLLAKKENICERVRTRKASN